MKIFIAIAVLVACVFAEEFAPKSMEQLKDITAACIKKHSLSKQQVEKVLNFEYPNEEPVRKFMQCLLEEVGVFSPKTGYDIDRIVQILKVDIKGGEAEKCIAKYSKGGKATDILVYEVHECLKKTGVLEKAIAQVKKFRKGTQ